MQANKKLIKARNQKVAESRGPVWRENLVAGKLEAQLKPTKLKLKRVEVGVSQDDLAKKMGLSLSTYSSIERGKRLIRHERAKVFSEILKVGIEDIFEKSGSKFRAK